MKKKNKDIIINKYIFHEYNIIKEFTAGIVLKGWEVKSLRSKKINIENGYVFIKDNESYFSGVKFQPLISTKLENNLNKKNHKLLLKRKEINYLKEYNQKYHYTIVIISIFWKKNWAKAKIAIVKGKNKQDKRNEIKNKEWKIKKARILQNKFI